MVADKLLQSVKDSLGLVYDRTCEPEKVLAQVCLVSKSRVSTTATTLFNYVDFPWALSVKFPHTGCILGVRSLALHPNFDKQLALKQYQAQANSLFETNIVTDYDLASCLLEETMSELNPQAVQELNASLAIPLVTSPSDFIGELPPGMLPQVLQQACGQGTDGLLTILDNRNCPVARLSISQGQIKRVSYGNLVGEMAVFELVYRKPVGKFLFQTPDPFTWPQTPELNVPTDRLVAEAQRRASQLPSLINALGGSLACYQRAAQEFDASRANPQLAWVEEIVWSWLDGYLSLDNLSKRVGADSFTVICAVQEMINNGLIQMVTTSPFKSTKRLGFPLMPRPDLNVWDNLVGAYLDPLSGKLIGEEGNFFGAARPKDPKILLHTVSMPNDAKGAPLLKDNLLVGIHSGIFVPGPEQAELPGQLYQMMWVGAIQDISSGRMKSLGETSEEYIGQEFEATAEGEAQPRRAERPKRVGALICPNCKTANYDPGKCINCGTLIDATDESTVERKEAAKQLSDLRSATPFTGFTRKQILIAGAVLLVVSIVLMYFGSLKPAPEAQAPKQASPTPQASQGTQAPQTPTEKTDSPLAVSVARDDAGFKGPHPPGYWLEDTSALTNGMPSFGIYSDQHNQKILVVIWDNDTPAQNLDILLHKVPYTDFKDVQLLTDVKVERGETSVGGRPMSWFVGRYARPDEEQKEMALIGAVPLPGTGKKRSIVVIARPYNPTTKIFDYTTTLYLLDTMASAPTTAKVEEVAPEESTEEKKPVTPQELTEYRKLVETSIKGQYTAPEDSKKLKAVINFGLTKEGMLSKMEIITPSTNEPFDKAVIKALTAGQPYPLPPQGNPINLKLTVAGATVTVGSE